MDRLLSGRGGDQCRGSHHIGPWPVGNRFRGPEPDFFEWIDNGIRLTVT